MPKRFIQYVIDAVRRPRVELTRRQRQLRHASELIAHCWRVLQRHRAEGMAAELTYRTIFSLIPLVVLGLVTFRIFGGLETIEDRVEDQVYSFFGVPEIPETYADPEPIGSDGVVEVEVSPDEPELTEDSAPPPEDQAVESHTSDNPTIDSPADRRQVQASIRWALEELTGKVGTLDFASIGVFGLLLFIYAAIALADSVENVFNLVYEAPSGRPIHLRVAIHWSIITLGSGLLAMSLYLSGEFVEFVTSTTGLSVTTYVNHILAWLSSWVLLFLLYALMPNTKVSVRAAAVGAVVAATLWEVAKYGFQIYVSTAVPYSALYGSLGLIPLFLFWVYVTWLIILFGLVWTYTLQTAVGHIPTKEEDEVAEDLLLADPQWMLPLVIEVAIAFERGDTVLREHLQKRLGLPARVLAPMIDLLEKACILRRLESEKGDQLILGRPAYKITAADIIRAGRYQPASTRSRGWHLLAEMRERSDTEFGDRTLAELIQET